MSLDVDTAAAGVVMELTENWSGSLSGKDCWEGGSCSWVVLAANMSSLEAMVEGKTSGVLRLGCMNFLEVKAGDMNSWAVMEANMIPLAALELTLRANSCWLERKTFVELECIGFDIRLETVRVCNIPLLASSSC